MSLLKQQSNNDCYLACVANATGKNYQSTFPEEFLALVESTPGVQGAMIEQVWEMCGLKENVDYWDYYCGHGGVSAQWVHYFIQGRRAILTVPSLNNPPPACHAVYWDGRTLHDPSNLQVYKYLEQCYPSRIVIFNQLKNENPSSE